MSLPRVYAPLQQPIIGSQHHKTPVHLPLQSDQALQRQSCSVPAQIPLWSTTHGRSNQLYEHAYLVHAVLHRRVSPLWETGKAHLRIRAKHFGMILHHAFQASRLLELGLGGVGVFGIHKFWNEALQTRAAQVGSIINESLVLTKAYTGALQDFHVRGHFEH
jgi:3-deoxy-D-manno-octulosonic-acid transferase